jgi:ATP-dependent DNA helicase RecG
MLIDNFEDLLLNNQEMIKDNDNLYLNAITSYAQWEKATTDLTINDIDIQAIKKAYKAGYDLKRIDFGYKDEKDFLERFNLVSGDHLNNAGMFLFGNNKPIQVKVAAHPTSFKGEIIDFAHIEGNIIECFELILQFVSKNTHWSIDTHANCQESEISNELLRELLVNSFVQGEFSLSLLTHQVDIYPDRIEIFNPQYFPRIHEPTSLVEKMIEPSQGNLLISDVLYKTGVTAKEGLGLKKIFRYSKENKLLVEHNLTAQGVSFIFYRPQFTYTPKSPGGDKLSLLENKILRQIRLEPTLTINDIASQVSSSSRAVEKALQSLKKKGYIERIGNKRRSILKILKDND